MYPLRKIKKMYEQGRDYFKELEKSRAEEFEKNNIKSAKEKPARYPKTKKCPSCPK